MTRRQIEYVWLALLAFLIAAGCGEAEPKATNSATNATTNNGFPNVDPNVQPNSGGSSVTLVLNNTTDSTIYLDGNCDSTWYRLRDAQGDIVQPTLGCASCECGVESCAVCGACPPAEPDALAPGESLEWTWQGIYWASSSDEFRDSCRERRQFESGTFTAEFCYGFTAGEFEVTDLECRSMTFGFGSDSEVEHLPEAATTTDPVCETADSNGFFATCDACGDGDCDQIDAPTASGFACGCGGGCPCGFSCGSYEIAPNVVVDNICVR